MKGSPLIQQLTDIRSGKDPEAEKEKKEKEGQRKYLKDQQEELFAVLQAKAKKQKEDDERKKARRPQPFYIEDKKVERLSLSADERFVAVELVEEPKEQRIAQVPDYVTLSGFTDELKARVKVGDVPKRYSMSILNLETSRVLQVKLEDQDDNVSCFRTGTRQRLEIQDSVSGCVQPRVVKKGPQSSGHDPLGEQQGPVAAIVRRGNR